MRAVAAFAALALVAAANPGRTAVRHATGSFEVTMTPEAQAPAPAGGLPASRLGIAKTYAGGLAGTGQGTMLAAGTPSPGHAAAYVAVEQFSGAVDGRQGGFVLLHRGTMTAAGQGDLQVTVAPDTGTGALAGIAGTLAIEVKNGRHTYDFAYTLPE